MISWIVWFGACAMSSFVMTVVDAPTMPILGTLLGVAAGAPAGAPPPELLPPVLVKRVALTLISGSCPPAFCACAGKERAVPARHAAMSAKLRGVFDPINKVTCVLRRFVKSRRRGNDTLRHDEARQANAAKGQLILEETSHRPVLRNGYVTSPLRNTAPSHAPCDGRMTGTGRSPGSRIIAVARLPKLSFLRSLRSVAFWATTHR